MNLNGLTTDMQLVVKGLDAWLRERNSKHTDEVVEEVLHKSGLVYENGRWRSSEARQADTGLIVKSNTDQRLVFGWANVIATEDDTIVFDRQRDFIDDEWELEKAAYNYVLDSRQAGEEHLRVGVGKAVESMVFTKDKMQRLGIPDGTLPVGWWIGFKVEDDDVWDLVKSGKYTSFSIHGKGKRKATKTDGKLR